MTSIIPSLRALFNRDLSRLHKEISNYTNEENLWKVDHEISNSAGNLALHLVGNLNTFIAGEIGGSGYVRKREDEFSLRNVPREDILTMISNTQLAVDNALADMDVALLDQEYPILVFKEPQSYQHFLIHLATHLGYHLGQVNYHRRLLDK